MQETGSGDASDSRAESKPGRGKRVAHALSEALHATDDGTTRALIAALGHDAAGVDTLSQRTGLDASVVAALLLTLELDGRIAAAPGSARCKMPASRSEFRHGERP